MNEQWFNNNRWILMTERKPEFPKHSLWGNKRAIPERAKKYEPFEEKYLVCTDKGNIYVANWYATADGEPFWYGKCRGANIVAWMPLPEPYEVKE